MIVAFREVEVAGFKFQAGKLQPRGTVIGREFHGLVEERDDCFVVAGCSPQISEKIIPARLTRLFPAQQTPAGFSLGAVTVRVIESAEFDHAFEFVAAGVGECVGFRQEFSLQRGFAGEVGP